MGPQERKLSKGELLFSEGENSRAMYVLKSGMIRIFKKKGDSDIEIDTVRAGQILGELAFLDGNPRSASGEALTECHLVEVSGQTFQSVLNSMPDWLKLLLKTVVGRLRTASTRIRQLESASTSYDYDKDGKRSAQYVYLSSTDFLKIASAVLLCASRTKSEDGKSFPIRGGHLTRYANQIMGVPAAKITTAVDVLSQGGILTNDDPENPRVTDVAFLEQLIAYLNEEYLLEPSKRKTLSLRGFLVMSLIAKHIKKFPVDAESGVATVDLAEILKTETAAMRKEPFRLEEYVELAKLGYGTNMDIRGQDSVLTQINVKSFLHAFRLQRVAVTINAVNEQKRKGGR